jgi:MtrB/PioB family decaheme-associated outer membrane protein
MASRAHAADAAPLAVPLGVPWWFHGYLETGGRFFLNNPQNDGVSAFGGKSLAKFYEYSSRKPGPFVGGILSAGSLDGVYRADFLGANVGYSDQEYRFDFSKAGVNYLSVGWDQSPHLYSTSARTIYNGVGTGALTLPGGLSNQLAIASGGGNNPTPAQAAQVQSIIDANTRRTDIGIRRDTFSVENRWTPTEAWDVRVNYSNTRRRGTQVDGVGFDSSFATVSQVTAPVADTTQNYGISGEYAGTSPWGQKFNAKFGYAGSTYTDDLTSYTVENPFCTTGALSCNPGGQSGPLARMSMAPDNQANAFTGTFGVELPFKSRYMSTISYEMMRQNQAFLPFTINPNTGALINGANPASVAALPAASLNGAINTLLSNNVLTTQITPDLKSKASYRYYAYNNNTPEIQIPNWVINDAFVAGGFPWLAPVNTLSLGYVKQNFGEELVWRPARQWNIGAAYGFERYDFTRADATATNEHSAKAFLDWKPAVWLTARTSWVHGERRYETYDYLGQVGAFQWPLPGASTRYSTAMRQFYLDNRTRDKGQFSLAVDLIRGLTVTPTLGILNDNYQISDAELGLMHRRITSAGVELAYVLNPGTTLLFSYMNEHYDQSLRTSTVSAGVVASPANLYSTQITDRVNTYMIGINQAVIPDKLDVRLSYTLADSENTQPVVFANGNIPSTGQYPPVTTTWQRLDGMARYRFDPTYVRQLGFQGDVYAKLFYSWERNNVTDWQNDLMQTYMYAVSNSTGYMTWLAYNNPNYNVHRLGASLAFTW